MWLSVTQLAGLLNISERAVRKALAEKRYSTARYADLMRGGCGGKVWEISAHDPAIPASVRKSLGIEEQGDIVTKIIEEAQRMAIAPEMLNDEKTALRLRVLRRLAERPQEVKKGDWHRLVSQEEGVPVKTMYRWVAEAERGKITSDRAPLPVAIAVESGPIKIEVKSRSFTPQALEYGLSLLINNPRKDVKYAYQELCIKAETEGWELGSLNSFYRAYRQLPPVIGVLASSGKRGAESIIKPAIYRDMTNVGVYDILIGDQHIFDYIVFDDDGEPFRPEMFAWVDAKSRYFSGIWPVMGHYDKYAVGFALREACRYGLPKELYNDWGKPECSKYVTHLRRQLSGKTVFKQGYEDFGDILEQTRAKPRNAQAKAIESYFYHTVENPLKQLGIPGYARRDNDDKKNEHIQGELRRQIKDKKLLHVKDFLEIVLQVFDDWHKHTMTVDKTVPEDVFAGGIANLHKFDDRTLDFLFWPAERRLVRNSMVEMTLAGFGKCKWYAPELSALSTRGRRMPVEVRFNPYDPSKVYILDVETHKSICIAEQWGDTDPRDRTAVARKIRRQNQLLGWWVDAFKQLAKPEIKIHQFTPYEGAEICEMEKARTEREEIVINGDALDRKIINLSKELSKRTGTE